MLRKTVLVLQIIQEQKSAIRAKAEKSCELPYVWSIPRLTGLKEILGMNWIHFSTSEKDCICTLLCQRDSVKETHFKNLFKQSLYLQTGEFKGIPASLNGEHSWCILNGIDSMHFLSTQLFRNAKCTCVQHLKAFKRERMPFSLFGYMLIPLKHLSRSPSLNLTRILSEILKVTSKLFAF